MQSEQHLATLAKGRTHEHTAYVPDELRELRGSRRSLRR
jgi:hypothetical protein